MKREPALEPGPPCPDQNVCDHGNRRECNSTLHPVMVELLSLFVGQPGYGSPIRHTNAPLQKDLAANHAHSPRNLGSRSGMLRHRGEADHAGSVTQMWV